ncbi:hypothetical protein [Collimonas humicola]|uniref:hypothetical protein n=1 Tax=Collimonas humicola TaxID=2825886 RepID=UPI001B8AE42B|nr:hypothetical protein [Collimonas humicola]
MAQNCEAGLQRAGFALCLFGAEVSIRLNAKLIQDDEMIVIWKGWGLLVIVITALIVVLTTVLFEKAGLSVAYGGALGMILSAGAIWLAGNKFNSPQKNRVLLDKRTGAEVILKPDHSLFFIKMQYWAFIAGAIGLFMLVNLLAGRSS